MNKVGYVLTFTLGAAAGSLLTWKLIEQKYKQIADDEIESVKEHYKNRDKMLDIISDEEESDKDLTSEELKEYEDQLKDFGYSVKIEEDTDVVQPYVISPEEFGDKPGFDTESWTYYADLVLTNEDDEIVGNPENFIGDGLNHFGDFDDDSVYIRNENAKCDYEILKHIRPFSENDEEAN